MFNSYILKKQKTQASVYFKVIRYYSKLEKINSKSVASVDNKLNFLSPTKNISLNELENNNKSLVPLNVIGETKHYPPANKEGANSVYTYNKKSLRSLFVKDNMAKKLIKSFFNLHIEKKIARSKRMRSLIRKSTTRKLFVSSPEIKQTNDKTIVTVYTFDRERQFLFRKLYLRLIKWERFKRIRSQIKPVEFSKYDKWRMKKKISLPRYTYHDKIQLSKGKRTKNTKYVLTSAVKYILGETLKHGVTLNASVKKYEFKKPIPRYKYPKTYQFSPPTDMSDFEKRNKRYFSGVVADGCEKIIPFMKRSKKIIKVKVIIDNTVTYKKKTVYSYRYIYYFFNRHLNPSCNWLGVNTFIKRKKTYYPKRITFKYGNGLKKTSRFKSIKTYSKKRSLMFLKSRSKIIRKKIPYFGFKHSNHMDFSNYKIKNTKLKMAKKMLLYFYLAHILSLFKIKMLSFEDTLKINLKKLKKLKKEDYEILVVPKRKKNHVISKKEKNILIKKKIPYYIRRFQQYKLPKWNKNTITFYIKSKEYPIKLKKTSFDSFTLFLLTFLKSILIKSNTNASNEKIQNHFNKFSAKYFLHIFYKSLYYAENKDTLKKNLARFNRKVLTINSLIKLAVNQTKFGKFLLPLKLLISKIYNKKTELNIVNLKSPHLNTDIFTQAVAVKLKKRVGLLRVMRRSLQLVKLPSRFKNLDKGFNPNKLGILNTFKSLNLSNLKKNIDIKNIKVLNYTPALDSLQGILKTLYPRSFVFKPIMSLAQGRLTQSWNASVKKSDARLNKLSGVLNTIKYKWVTGVRLEAAGRLTRRYTAARAVFKFRQKGSLKNTDYSRKLDFLNNSMPNILLRNLAKSNSQHSFLKSKKRIGAFGLKTWMSSY